jgi:hypothetical protein
MGRKLLMVMLGLGAVAGFASGFAHLGGWCRYGYGAGGPFDRRSEFQRHVADTCTEAALRVYNQKNPEGAKP